MNRQKITDERVVRLNQKVQSEGFQAALLWRRPPPRSRPTCLTWALGTLPPS